MLLSETEKSIIREEGEIVSLEGVRERRVMIFFIFGLTVHF